MSDEFSPYQSDLEVVFSVMADKELLMLSERLDGLIVDKVYEDKSFPLSLAEIRHIQATISFSFWCRKGKGVRVVSGVVKVCELKDSPFYIRYQPKSVEDVGREEEGEWT